MMLIDADTIVTVKVFDDMTEEWYDEKITVAEALDRWADEGCPKPVDAELVRHGAWKAVKVGSSNYPFWDCQCSMCKWTTSIAGAGSFRNCPNCGAKMEGGV